MNNKRRSCGRQVRAIGVVKVCLHRLFVTIVNGSHIVWAHAKRHIYFMCEGMTRDQTICLKEKFHHKKIQNVTRIRIKCYNEHWNPFAGTLMFKGLSPVQRF